MDTQVVTIDTANYDMVAAAMGMLDTSGPSSRSSDALCRMRIWNKAIMGTMENGKKRQVEVVPGGTFRLDDGTGNFKYCESLSFRPFLQRYRYNRWVPFPTPDPKGRKGRYIKSAFTHDYRIFNSSDLIDDDGGFNCGRPSGFIKDWKEVPEATRKLITSVRRVRAIFGTIAPDENSAVNEAGEAMPSDGDTIPVIWEIENNTAFKVMGEALAKYRNAGRLFPQHEINLSTEGAPMMNGNMLYQPLPTIHLSKEIELKQPEDNDMLMKFSTWVDNYNKYIKEAYDQKAKNTPFTDKEVAVLNSFVPVEDNQ